MSCVISSLKKNKTKNNSKAYNTEKCRNRQLLTFTIAKRHIQFLYSETLNERKCKSRKLVFLRTVSAIKFFMNGSSKLEFLAKCKIENSLCYKDYQCICLAIS